MAQATTDALASVEQLDTVVDADAHVRESVDDLVPHIDDQYEAVRRIIQECKRPMADIYSVTHAMPPIPFTDSEYDTGRSSMEYGSGEEYSPEVKLSEMTDFGIDYGVLDPTLNLGLMTVENPHVAVALANAYNSWILDEYTDDADEFVATILAAPHRPEQAAEEIDDRGTEDDMVGVFLPTTGIIPPLGHPMYDPIYEAAQDHGLPIVMHGGNLATSHAFPIMRRFNEHYAENHVIVHPFGHLWHLTTMLVRGVPERFPDLEFVFQESGIGWVPYAIWRLDDHYLELSHEFHLRKLPSEYIHDSFYFTTQPLGHTADNPEHLARMIELAGPGNIMYASDLPHTDFDPPEELFDRINRYFDQDTVRAMMGETAVDVFDLRV